MLILVDNGVEMEQKWIAFVSLLAPNEDLFKVALSTYDLGLAHAVVQNLQIVMLMLCCQIHCFLLF